MTAHEFTAFLSGAGRRLCSEWLSNQRSDPEVFPDRLPLADWWEHFAHVVAPELLAVATGRGGQPEPRGAETCRRRADMLDAAAGCAASTPGQGLAVIAAQWRSCAAHIELLDATAQPVSGDGDPLQTLGPQSAAESASATIWESK